MSSDQKYLNGLKRSTPAMSCTGVTSELDYSSKLDLIIGPTSSAVCWKPVLKLVIAHLMHSHQSIFDVYYWF